MAPPPNLASALEPTLEPSFRARSPTPIPTPVSKPGEAPLFLRLTEDGQGIETAIATYQRPKEHPGGEKTIHLVGAVHLGEPDYFQALQMFLDRTGHVFYERSADPDDPISFAQRISGANAMVQGIIRYHHALAEHLGLKYQGDAMAYDRPHFKRVDITKAAALRELNTAHGFQRIPRQLQLYLMGLIGVVGAHENVPQVTKEQFASDLARRHTQDKSPDFIDAVFRGYRNELVESFLNNWSREFRSELGVFYGAGHMRPFHRHITSSKLGYVPVETQWLRAF